MDNASGACGAGHSADDRTGGRAPNAGSFGAHRGNLESGAATRYARRHPLPGIGDSFGELTVVGYVYGNAGGVSRLRVACTCGAEPHEVWDYNLRKGVSTRCNACAKLQAAHWRKNYWAYADIVPDDAHRRRLLNRISACIQRCQNPRSAEWKNYGARGIHVHEAWRDAGAGRRAFLAHLVTLAGWDDPALELDRERNGCGYEPGNLRFVTKRVNIKNRETVCALRHRIIELEARVRYLERGAAPQVHDPDAAGAADRS